MRSLKSFLVATATVALISATLPSLALAAEPAATSQPAPNPVEARIASLHDALHVTEAQTPQWNAVADAMRANARDHDALMAEIGKTEESMTAAEDLHAYERVAETHAAGIKRLATVFDTFYATLSDTQKKTADDLFRANRDRMKAAHAAAQTSSPAPQTAK